MMAASAALLLVSAALLLPGCGLDSPMTTVEPKSDLGRAIHDLFMNISGWALLIFVVVEALLVGVVFAFRDRPGREEPRAVHGHLGLEIAAVFGIVAGTSSSATSWPRRGCCSTFFAATARSAAGSPRPGPLRTSAAALAR